MTSTSACPVSGPDFTLMDPAVLEAPFADLDRLREEAPAYKDAVSGIWIVTRFEDVKRIHRDPVTFSTKSFVQKARNSIDRERASKMVQVYREKGWLPGKALAIFEGEEHLERRLAFMRALRVNKIKELRPVLREIAMRLIDAFADNGRCDFVESFARPLPMTMIATQLGAKPEDVPMIQGWTDLWIERLGMMQTPEQEMASVEAEIAAQHHFKPLMDRMRAEPDGSVLSDLLNTTFSDGEKMSDREFFGHMMPDMFVGGSETAANAMASAMMVLCREPGLEDRLRADPERLAAFIEEAMRMESPVQMLFRTTTQEVELSGVTVPAGEVVGAHYGAANRDERRFACPAQFDLERADVTAHAVFGPGGPHVCIGAPLARLELRVAFETLLERLEGFAAPAADNDFAHHPNMVVRSLKALNITFQKRAA